MDLDLPIFILFILLLIITIQESRSKQYGIPSKTLNGEKVKSKGEKYIADFLSENGIRYKYEKTFTTKKGKKIHPDFYLPDYDVFVEYWGLVDADDPKVKNSYIRSMRWKMAQYHSKKQKFISIYPRNLDNLDWVFMKKFEKETGIKLLN
ncbi:MAG: hypothetical protein NWE89_01180 [Candidatus Bathyarchaeota archaeon]|nr:hypothetical protein [Candidatus Bathyarchaeota archaeon]